MKVIFVVGSIWIKRHSLAQSGHLSWTSWGNILEVPGTLKVYYFLWGNNTPLHGVLLCIVIVRD